MTKNPLVLLCPKCHQILLQQETEFVCQNCGSNWFYHSGIVHLKINSQFYWGLLPENEMEALLAKTRSDGYQQSINEILLPKKGTHIARYALDECRDGFKVVLPISKNTVVLDIGSGWGAVAISLARSCKWVIAMDTVVQNLEFVQARASQENIENISLLCVDPLDYGFIPIQNETVDIVLLNGVLEWVGTALSEKSPTLYQQLALQEIIRVLKPGGVIYVGIENRIGIPLLLGKPDSHSGLRYATLLPRFLASLYSKLVKKIDYRTYTYTYKGYERLLQSVGFDEIKFYWPVFTYQDPEYIVSLGDRSTLRYLLRYDLYESTKSIRKKLILRFVNFLSEIGFLKYLVYSYSIIGTKKC